MNPFACLEYVHVSLETKLCFDKIPKLFYLFQLESFDKNKDGEIELSEMAKLVSLCSWLVVLFYLFMVTSTRT